MKLVQKFAIAVIFVSALAVPTFAGDMQTPGKTDPPPPPGSSVTSTTTDDPAPIAETTQDNLLYEAYMAMLGLY